MEQDHNKNSGFDYKELLAVFMAVAITAMATQAGNLPGKYACLTPLKLWEIILFFIFYTALRVKWYLDDIKEHGIKLQHNPQLDSAGNFMLVFALASWALWITSVFLVYENMFWAYMILLLGILAGTVAALLFGRISKKCQCFLIMMNVFYILLLFAAAMSSEGVNKVACLVVAIVLVGIDAALGRTFSVDYSHPKSDTNGNPCCYK